jgi:hypothetical protein
MKLAMTENGCQLIDCGSASRQTRGLPIGFFLEGAPPPFYLTFIGF